MDCVKGQIMKIIVNVMPKKPSECLFAKMETVAKDYVCKLAGSTTVCNPETCRHLKPIDRYVDWIIGWR